MAEVPTPPPVRQDDDDPAATLQVLGVLLGVVSLLMAGLALYSVLKVESSGGKLNIIVALLYRIGGKSLSVGFFVVLAAVCFGGAWWATRQIKRSSGK